MNEQPTPADTAATATAPVAKLPEPDALTTPDIEIDEEEHRWRNVQASRLSRKLKPAISQARFDELEARAKEVQGLVEEQAEAREAKDEAKIHELDIQIAKRRLPPYDKLCLELAQRFGLLNDEDRRNLRAADVRRKQKTLTMKARAAFGEFRASERTVA